MQRICIHHYCCSVDAPSFLYFLSFPGFGSVWCVLGLFLRWCCCFLFALFFLSLLCICVDSVFWGINFCTSSIWRIFFDAINFEHFFFFVTSSLLRLLLTLNNDNSANTRANPPLSHFNQTAIFTFSSLISTTQHSTTTSSSHNNFNTPIKLHNIDFTTLPPAAATTALSQLKSRQLDCHCARINQQNEEHQHRSTATLPQIPEQQTREPSFRKTPKKWSPNLDTTKSVRQSIAQLRFHHHTIHPEVIER